MPRSDRVKSFDEYAALARQLHDLHRSGEQTAAQAAQRRDAALAGVHQLGQRLAVQRQRLDQLARALGQPPPALAPSAEPATRAPVEPAPALESARHAADAADEAALRAETMAQRPALLPAWSPFARAATVYAGCALVAVILQYALVLAANADALDTISLFAWMCAGLPAIAFFAGYLVLSRWGKPRIEVGKSPRYTQLGFAICFLAMPVAYCAFELVTRMS